MEPAPPVSPGTHGNEGPLEPSLGADPQTPEAPLQVVVLRDEADPPPDMTRVERLASVRYVGEDGLTDALPGADVLFVYDFASSAPARAWPERGGPRWVHVASAGVDRLMFPALVDGDTVLTNSRGVFEQPIAEYVLGLVLCFAKDLHGTLRLQAGREWRHRETERIAGARALVVGTGPIGRTIGRTLSAVGMHVTGIGRTARPGDPDLGDVLPDDRLHDAVAGADYVVLAAPLTDRTRGMVDAAALARMRPGARLINVGRGALVVQDDLVEALRTGRIAGAALDVFAAEPLPRSSPLWDLPNVIVSPHMSGDAVGWKAELVRLFADNLDRYRTGRTPLNVVDKRLGYVRSGTPAAAY